MDKEEIFIGLYSQLRIGKLSLQWRYYVPPVAILLFDDDDFYSVVDEVEGYYEDNGRGYRSTCGKCLNVLDNHGYDLDFFVEVYDAFHDEINYEFINGILSEYYIESLDCEDKKIIGKSIENYEIKYPKQSRKKDLLDFIEFIKIVLSMSNNRKISQKRSYQNKFLKGLSNDYCEKLKDLNLSNPEAIGDFLILKPDLFPSSIVKVSSLFFYEDYYLNYRDILDLMYIRLIIQSMSKNQKVFLDLTEFSENDGEAKSFYEELTTTLAKKSQLYNSFFKAISRKDEDLREKWTKDKSRSLLNQLEDVSDKNEKGKMLEELFSIIFESNNELQIIEKRYKIEDEEIDLIIKNNASKPFWLNLSSPIIFVECKNWEKPVGTSELRNFEIKLQNHQNLVRIGIFVAPGGFSKACDKSLCRSSREPYSIILIDKENLTRFTNSQLSLLEWLEENICRPI